MLRLDRNSVPGLLATAFCLAATFFLASGTPASGQTIQPPYDTVYTLTDLGSVPGLPTPYGGLDFLLGNPNVIVIGGSANNAAGALYSIGVVRNAQSQITGFSGTAAFFSDGQYNDGGVVFGPGGVLFYTRYPVNQVGQVEPGSAITDKIIDLTPLGVSSSVGALNFVPPGFPGAGQLKIVSYNTADWYTASYAPDGAGTYNITSATLNTTIQGGPEGFIYVPVGSPVFPASSMLVSEYGNGVVSIYQFDANGNPNPATRALFIGGLTGAEGAVIDPLTGDFLFSTFGGTNRVIVVRGFALPSTPCVGAPSGLVGWWPGDGNTNDIVGGNDGTLQGAATFAAGEVDQAFSFPTPLTGYVDIPYASNPSPANITVAAWVNPASIQGTASIFNWRPGANNVGVTLEQRFTGDGTVLWNVIAGGSAASVVSAGALPLDTWTHVAGTYDGTTARLYFNGGEVANVALSGSIDPIAADAQIGRNIVTGGLVDGLIDEVQVFDRALSAAEIQAIFDANGGGVCKVSPKPMSVDAHDAGAGSNVNGVLEPGETVLVAPAWQNEFYPDLAVTGTASNLTGPAGPTYTIDDGSADYGTLSSAATDDCYSATQNCYEMTVSGTRPVQHWDASFTESLDFTGGPLDKDWTLHVGDSFPDVPTSHLFYAFIENIFHNGITGGCGGGNYCPGNPVTRAQMAVFLLKAAHGSGFVPPPCTGAFPDVLCPSQFADWIEELFLEGITGGCGGGNYCPANPVTRAQMAVFLLKSKHGSAYAPPPCTGIFADVECTPAPAFAVDWIEQLFNEGVTGGCGGGNYCPNTPNNRGQMAVFLTKTFGLLLYGP